MKITYDKGVVSVDLASLLEHLPRESRLQMAEALACDDEIIRHIAAQLLDGWTEGGSYGATCCTAPHTPSPAAQPLDYYRREVARRAGEVAAKEIKRLEDAAAYWEKRYLEVCEQQRRSLRNRFRDE